MSHLEFLTIIPGNITGEFNLPSQNRIGVLIKLFSGEKNQKK